MTCTPTAKLVMFLAMVIWQLSAIWPWVIEIINSMANDSSPWHWMLLSTSLGSTDQGRCQCQRYFPAHFSDVERNSEHPSDMTQTFWKTSEVFLFCFFFLFPCGILVLLRKSLVANGSWPERWEKDKPRLQHWHKSTAGLKYFTPQGLFSPDLLTHLNKGSSGAAAAAAWLWLKDQCADWPRACLFGRAQTCSLFAQQAFPALWENSHMAIFLPRWRRNATMSVCSLRNGADADRLEHGPLVPVSLASLNSYNDEGGNRADEVTLKTFKAAIL